VIYVDGEMSAELLRQRAIDMTKRAGRDDLRDNLMLISADWAQELAKLFPTLPAFAPLNSKVGQEFVRALCRMLKPDLVVMDNVQSLLVGNMREEEPWNDTTPLVRWLTSQQMR
jgi:hypothetical protein